MLASKVNNIKELGNDTPVVFVGFSSVYQLTKWLRKNNGKFDREQSPKSLGDLIWFNNIEIVATINKPDGWTPPKGRWVQPDERGFVEIYKYYDVKHGYYFEPSIDNDDIETSADFFELRRAYGFHQTNAIQDDFHIYSAWKTAKLEYSFNYNFEIHWRRKTRRTKDCIIVKETDGYQICKGTKNQIDQDTQAFYGIKKQDGIYIKFKDKPDKIVSFKYI